MRQNPSFDLGPWRACTGNVTYFCTKFQVSHFFFPSLPLPLASVPPLIFLFLYRLFLDLISSPPPSFIFLSSSVCLSLSFVHPCKHGTVERIWDLGSDRSKFWCQLWHLLCDLESITELPWASVPSSVQWRHQYLPQRVTIKNEMRIHVKHLEAAVFAT